MPGAEQIPDTDRADRRRERGSRRSGVGLLPGFAVLALILLALAAVPARAQTMTQALAEAYNTNPQLLAQRALLRATDEQVPQALSGWRPTVNFTGQVGGARGGLIEPSLSAFSTFYQNSLNLQITQPVYSGGRTLAQTRQAINTVQATRAQTLAVETSVFQAVAQAYLDVVRDQALVEVDRNNVAVLRQQLEATQDRFRVGEVTRTDVAQAESSLAQAIGTLTAAEGTLRQSQAEYVRAVGAAARQAAAAARAPDPAGDARGSADPRGRQQFQRDFGEFFRARGARQYRRGARPAAAADFDRRQPLPRGRRRRSPSPTRSKIPARSRRR